MRPLMTGFTFGIVSLFLVYKGLSPLKIDVPIYAAIPAALVVAIISTILAVILPYLYERFLEKAIENVMNKSRRQRPRSSSEIAINKSRTNTASDIADVASTETNVVPIEDDNNYEQFDNANSSSPDQSALIDRQERLSFNFLVIVTSCAMAMAHGSNDIANAAGPLTAIVMVYQNGRVISGGITWVIVLMTFGLLVGLMSLGYKVMITIGSSITKMTSARAFVTQISTAFITLVFSNFGVPLSTTHIVVGAVLGISVADMSKFSDLKNLQWTLLLKIVVCWVITIPAAALISMGFFAIVSILGLR